MMKMVARDIEKKFNHRRVLTRISFELAGADSLVITGINGAGKTTLIKILSGLLSPTSGEVTYYLENAAIPREQVYRHIGLVGPYLQLYRDLTAWENLSFFAKARTGGVDHQRILSLLERFGLKGRQMDPLKSYSSGMLQRVKYVMALYDRPRVLFLDEPTSNLDEAGKQLVYEVVQAQKRDNIVIIATNEPEEIRLAEKRVDVA